MMNNFQYVITLPKATDIMVVQGRSTVGTYSLENLELEYETIENKGVASEVSSSYTTVRFLAYKHCTLMKRTYLNNVLAMLLYFQSVMLYTTYQYIFAHHLPENDL